jgi:hypothetical protein
VSFEREGLGFLGVATLAVAGIYALALNRRSWPLWLLALALTILALGVAYYVREPRENQRVAVAPAEREIALLADAAVPAFVGRSIRPISISTSEFKLPVDRYRVSGR